MVLFIGAIMSVDNSLYEAADLDGANGTGTYFIIMDQVAHTSLKVGLASAMAVFLLCLIYIVTVLQKIFFKYVFRNADTENTKGASII